MIKGGKSMIVQTQTLLDSGASACFNDKGLVGQHNLAFVEKMTPMAIKVVNGRNLCSGAIMHDTKALTVIIESHSSKVVFNVISSSTNPIIIGLSWFVLHELVNETTQKYEAFPTSTLDFERDFVCEDPTKINQHMQKFKHEGDVGGNQGSKHFKPLFMKARTFIQATRKEMHSLCMPF
jgi:hypothetical protein